MRFAEDKDTGSHLIQRYAEGELQVGEVCYRRSLVIMPGRLIEDWEPQAAAQLDASHLQGLLELGADILILGTGARQQFPSPALQAMALTAGVGLEVMDTPSACRTYNVLAGERRRVAAALMMI